MSLLRIFYLLARGRVCEVVGHEGSWVLGVSLGFTRPVCERCRRVL